MAQNLSYDINNWPVGVVEAEASAPVTLSPGGIPILVVPPDTDAGRSDKLTRLFNKLHDALYLRWCGRAKGSDLNPLTNYDIYYGRLDPYDHWDALAPFGDLGRGELRHYSLFDANLAVLRGMVGQAQLDWSLECISPEVSMRKVQRVATAGAEGMLREAAARMASEGLDLREALTDPSVPVPATLEKLESMLSDKEEFEMALYDALRASLLKDRTKKKLDDCIEDRMIVNREIGEVYVENGWPRFRALRDRQVSWWGPDEMETADEADAWQVHELIPINQAVQKYGIMLEKAGTYEEFLRLMKQVQAGAPLHSAYASGGADVLRDPYGSVVQDAAGEAFSTYGGYYRSGYVPQVLEQRLQVKLINFRAVRLTLNGTVLDAQQFERFQDGTFSDAPAVRYQAISEEEYAARRGQPGYKRVPYVELWESCRLGSRHLVYYRKAPYQLRHKDDPENVHFTIRAHFGRDTSMVTKGLPFHELYTNMATQARKLVAMMGVPAMTYDMSALPDGYDLQRVVYEARETGIIVFNGQQINGAPTKESYRHLQKIDMGLNEDLVKLINSMVMIKGMWKEVSGVTGGMVGEFQSREAASQTQVAMSQGAMMTYKIFAEHAEFVEDVLGTMATVGKYVFARDERRDVLLGEEGRKTLQLSEEIARWDYGIFLTNSMQSREDRQWIMAQAERALSSGKISFPDVLRLYYAKNPIKMLDILQEGLTTAERVAAQTQQQMAAAAQQQAEAATMRAQAPVQAAEVTGRYRLMVEELKQQMAGQRQQTQQDFQADQVDVSHQQGLHQQGLAAMAGSGADAASVATPGVATPGGV